MKPDPATFLLNDLHEYLDESGMSIDDFAQAIQAASGHKFTGKTLSRIILKGKWLGDDVMASVTETAREVVQEIIPLFKASPEIRALSPEAVRYCEADLYDPQVGVDLDYLFAAQDANPKLKKISHVFYKYKLD